MAKMRIYEIARSMQQQNKNIKSADLVAFLNANGYEAKSGTSMATPIVTGCLARILTSSWSLFIA